MTGIAKLRNTIQEYEWGSRTALSAMLGRPAPSERPEAELWMGAHPKAPSAVMTPEGERSLADLIAEDPEAVLGPAVSRRFGGVLPFLFKVLAAAEPLSIQAHPSREQARRGFAAENARHVPPGERNYVDDNHKPEVLCAVTPFHALSGFRDPGEAAGLLAAFGLTAAETLGAPPPRNAGALACAYGAMLALPQPEKDRIVSKLAAAARRREGDLAEVRWVTRALEAHPGDFGAINVLLLNLVELAPGQALYQEAGILHAYLEGVGIELMANSDNVLRGGLTRKRVDAGELLRVVDFRPAPPRLVAPVSGEGAEQVYATPAAEFRLSRLALRGRWSPGRRPAIELWVLTEGACRVEAGAAALSLRAGESFVVPACVPAYAIEGEGLLFRATVPDRG